MTNSYTSIRIIFADDHELMHEGLAAVLKKQTEIEIAGEAKNGEQLVNMTRALKPDVIVTDIQMPKMNGIDATKQILKEFPHIGIIAFSMFEEEELIVQMLRAGAKGYILKNSHKDEIVEAIKTVNRGDTFYCRQTTNMLSDMRVKNGSSAVTKTHDFTKKEIVVIKLMSQGLSNVEIAEKVELSPRTVEGYRLRISNKIGAKNAAGIILYAIKNKLFDVAPNI